MKLKYKPKSMPYYNTVDNKKDEVKSIKRNLSQQKRILEFLKKNPGRSFTPYQIQAQFPFLITSVRRALTNLAYDGDIVCDGSKMERYGEPNKTYKYNK